MTRNGLTRLVMIGSGVSDYVDIQPSKSTHLVVTISEKHRFYPHYNFVDHDWKHMDFPKVDLKPRFCLNHVKTNHFEIKDAEGTEHMVIFRGNGLVAIRDILGG